MRSPGFHPSQTLNQLYAAEIWDWLEKEGLLENTIFVYSSDQGFYLGEHGWFDKRFMYDESYRTPLLMSWPGVTEPGSVCSNLVSNLDFAQTFLDAAGAVAPFAAGTPLRPPSPRLLRLAPAASAKAPGPAKPAARPPPPSPPPPSPSPSQARRRQRRGKALGRAMKTKAAG